MAREEVIKNYIRDSLQLLAWLENCRRISESYPEVCKKIDRLEEENTRLDVTHWTPLYLYDLKEER